MKLDIFSAHLSLGNCCVITHVYEQSLQTKTTLKISSEEIGYGIMCL